MTTGSAIVKWSLYTTNLMGNNSADSAETGHIRLVLT